MKNFRGGISAFPAGAGLTCGLLAGRVLIRALLGGLAMGPLQLTRALLGGEGYLLPPPVSSQYL